MAAACCVQEDKLTAPDQHDYRRVDAWIVRCPAVGAFSAMARVTRLAWGAAARTEPVCLMPGEYPTPKSQQSTFRLRHRGSDIAQIAKGATARKLRNIPGLVVTGDINREISPVTGLPEQDKGVLIRHQISCLVYGQSSRDW